MCIRDRAITTGKPTPPFLIIEPKLAPIKKKMTQVTEYAKILC